MYIETVLEVVHYILALKNNVLFIILIDNLLKKPCIKNFIYGIVSEKIYEAIKIYIEVDVPINGVKNKYEESLEVIKSLLTYLQTFMVMKVVCRKISEIIK